MGERFSLYNFSHTKMPPCAGSLQISPGRKIFSKIELSFSVFILAGKKNFVFLPGLK
jgi:hypothetical protein